MPLKSLVNLPISLHYIKVLIREQFLSQLLIQLLREEDDFPANLVQVPCQWIKHIIILHFQLRVDRLSLYQCLL